MKKILVVEDDKTIREELASLLTTAEYDVITLDCFSNTVEDIIKFSPDLVLLDINIPSINGEIVLKELRKKSNVLVIMVTSKNNEIDEVLSISYGADDYITKPYNPTILLLRIGNVFKRLEQNTDNYSYKGLTIVPSKGMVITLDKEVSLTKNEMIIFCYLLNNQGKIVTRDDLMTDLWNNEEYVNDNALTVNISRLRSKLKEIGYEDIIETRKNQGYILL